MGISVLFTLAMYQMCDNEIVDLLHPKPLPAQIKQHEVTMASKIDANSEKNLREKERKELEKQDKKEKKEKEKEKKKDKLTEAEKKTLEEKVILPYHHHHYRCLQRL